MAKLQRLQPPEGWQVSVRQWEAFLQARRLSAGTIRQRTYSVIRFALDTGIPNPAIVTLADLELWLSGTGDHHWQSTSTAYGHRSGLCGFFGYCASHGLISSDPADDLAPIRRREKVPTPCPEWAVKKAIDEAEPREVLMVRLAAEHGLRCGEISRLRGTDLVERPDGFAFVVRGKGDKERVAFLDPSEQALISAFRNAGGKPLFPGKVDGHISPARVGKLISRALPPGWTAHKLRTRFATTTYRSYRDLLTLQQLLGHASPNTTKIYVLLEDQASRAMSAAALLPTANS